MQYCVVKNETVPCILIIEGLKDKMKKVKVVSVIDCHGVH